MQPSSGYSLMVKLQPSKLITRVRFPLPAPLLFNICPSALIMKTCVFKKLGVVAAALSCVCVASAITAEQKQQAASAVATQIKKEKADTGKMVAIVRDAVQKSPDAVTDIVRSALTSFDAKKNLPTVKEVAIAAVMAHETPYRVLKPVSDEVQSILGNTDDAKNLVKDLVAYVATKAADSPLVDSGETQEASAVPFRSLLSKEDARRGNGSNSNNGGPIVVPPPSPDVSVQ